MALIAVPMALAGQAAAAVYAMLGAFTTTFGRNFPYARRGRVLALVAVVMTACVGGGTALGVWARPQDGGVGAAVVVAAMAVVAGAAKLGCDAARLRGLGAVLLLFAFAVSAYGAPAPSDVLTRTALAALGAVVAWALAMLGRFAHPERPQRLAVAVALRELAGLLDAGTGSGGGEPGTGTGSGGGTDRLARHQATAAVLEAHRALGLPPATATERGRDGGPCVRLAAISWTVLIRSASRPPDLPAAMAGHLRGQAVLLLARRRGQPDLLPDLAALAEISEGTEPAAPARSDASLERRAGVLTLGRRADPAGRASRRAVLLVPALRMTVGTGLAGGAALLLGLGHGYWAAISAAAVLHSINVRTAAQRAVQRTLGTAAGLALALAVLALHPGPLTLVLIIVLLEFLLEYGVAHNYGIGVVFLTPLALLMSDLATPVPAEDLVQDRALGSVVGIVVALLCALVLIHGRAAERVRRALTACGTAAELAERALRNPDASTLPELRSRLAAAVVELREADDAAAGELWPAELDPTELAAAEQRAYRILRRLG
ncbi:FUSC family protein [Streptomyces endophyticus]|uniref:FUSC family protein n=1 Tax=Streptomyces endophyticus TaxID=714166 RepID=A0ABU6FF83_9ACTN|nr:FUSC family protein [Streptomyces endophyticus]MEB8341940.1 FUSC family protein [Streptomyces endophyticus]